MDLSNELRAPDYLQLTTSLALELAQRLSPPADVFRRAGLNDADAMALLRSPEFTAMVKAAKAEWDGVGNIPERIRLKAQMALEELMLPQFQMARDSRTPATARNEAFKSFERLAGTSQALELNPGPNSPRFILNINLGGAAKTIEGSVINGSDEEKLLETA